MGTCDWDLLLTMSTECGKADGEGVCGENDRKNESCASEKMATEIGRIKREMFVNGVVELSERVGK